METMDHLVQTEIPVNCNPFTREKFEAIDSYDQYEGVVKELNQSFHYSYNRLIHKTHELLGKETTPVIIMSHEEVMLFYEGEKETINVIPELYHQLKSIGHVSFGVYVSLANNGIGPVNGDIREELVSTGYLISQALNYLSANPLPEQYMDTQMKILRSAQSIINDVISAGELTEARLIEFCDESAPWYLEGAVAGARLEIDSLHETVMGWKERMGEENWERIHVVVCAAHQGRYREATLQYFQRLLGEQEGLAAEMEDRVIYAEHIDEPGAALDLLARHIVDQKASNDLFKDPLRLQRDLMADGAGEYLEVLLPD
jgi:hypothetical protein